MCTYCRQTVASALDTSTGLMKVLWVRAELPKQGLSIRIMCSCDRRRRWRKWSGS